jgi:7-cyano-7-deazaguanine synthase in queuosine biosynthesis
MLYAGEAGKTSGIQQEPREPVADVGTVTMIAFTGGKDSTAVALKAQGRGELVELFFIKGINPSYPWEEQRAAAIARTIGARLHILKVKPGKQPHIENPAKNAAILGLMVDYGQRIGAKRFQMGTQARDSVDHITFGAGFSDGIEFMDAAARLYESMSGNTIAIDTRAIWSEADSYKTIAGTPVWDLVASCMTPARYKQRLEDGNRAKYGPETIRPGRCGSCYKCAQEIIFGQMLGVIPTRQDARTHAERVLVDNAVRVFGDGAKRWTKAQKIEAFVDTEGMK